MICRPALFSVMEIIRSTGNRVDADPARSVGIRLLLHSLILFRRICRFKNLCYLPGRKQYFILRTNDSVFDNMPRPRDEHLQETSGIAEHNIFFFDFAEVSLDFLKNSGYQVEFINELTFLFSRFHVGNIMHSIHDELIAFYFILRKYAGPNLPSDPPSSIENIGLNHHIQFMEEQYAFEYYPLFKLFTNFPPRLSEELEKDNVITCFRDSVIGLSNRRAWYHFGFFDHQGPLNRTVNGYEIRQFAQFVEKRVGLKPLAKHNKPHRIVLFTRSSNRFILNQDQLVDMLEKKFHTKVDIVSMENNTFASQIEILRETKLAIGLHGSILIMGLFLPPESILIELFPYAIPSENYTPYRTMAGLPGMRITYRAWEVGIPAGHRADGQRQRVYYRPIIYLLIDLFRTNIETTLSRTPLETITLEVLNICRPQNSRP
jgi:protein O-mannose beta-1,4-N-acetylglucosaminyltransferase